MKKAVLTILSLVCTICFGRAQSANVSGSVLDSLSGKAVGGVTVKLTNSAGAVIKSTATNKSGVFAFADVAAGKYNLQISHIAYSPFMSPVFTVGTGDLKLPAYHLSDINQKLQTVTIRSVRQRISTRVDGYVYDAKNEIPIAGEKAGDLLRKLPGVMVDPEGAPSINGSGRVKVFIDGKPSELLAPKAADALKQIMAENVAEVVVINHPSAKYEGEGVDAVIEITTKKPTQNAASGNLSATLGNLLNEVTGYLIVRQGKWVMATGEGYNNYNFDQLYNLSRTGGGTQITQQRTANIARFNANGNIAIYYAADSLHTISMGYAPNTYQEGKNQFFINQLNSGGVASFNARDMLVPFSRWSHGANLTYNQKSADKRTDLNVALTAVAQPIASGYQLVEIRSNGAVYRENNQNGQDFRDGSLRVDYGHRFADAKNKLEFGGLLTTHRSIIQNYMDIAPPGSNVFLPDVSRSNIFTLRLMVSAFYGSYSFGLGKFLFRTGLRYEYTDFNMSNQAGYLAGPKYGYWLPNLLVSRGFKNHTLSLAYARKFQRPFLSQMNPTVNYIDSLNIESGNPYLKPVDVNQFTFSYMALLNKVTLTASGFLNMLSNNIETVRMIRPGGGTSTTYLNISSNTQYGGSFGINKQGKHFSFNITNTLRSVHFNTDGTVPAKSGFQYNLGSYFSYKFTSGYTLASYVNYATRGISLQGSSSATNWYNIILSKGFNKDRIALGARIDNLFSQYQYITEDIDSPSFTQQATNRNVYRFFKLSVTWKFGKKEVQKPAGSNSGGDN